MTTQTDQLIDALVSGARPVRRLRPPMLRAAFWLAIAGALIAAITVIHAAEEGEELKQVFGDLAQTKFTLQWLASLATGITAVIAAFELSLPDRSRAWRLLPVPAAVLWLLTVGYGCFTDWVEHGPEGFVAGHSVQCLTTIIGTSVPLGLGLAFMLRHAGASRPVDTIVIGALGLAALSATGLSLYHDLDATLMIIVWHVVVASLVVAISRLRARRRA